MANNVQINGSIGISDSFGSKNLSRAFSIVPTGTGFFSDEFTATTAAATLAHVLPTMRYFAAANKPDSAATITVTMSPIILRPGDVMVVPPGSITVTTQASGTASVKFAATGIEV